ncbi:MAG: DUF1775 domain-containing protein [Acidimicrobiia bacterium]|nr:DUF1775 domain-containing protein [Acidimicrobiia bacterium]
MRASFRLFTLLSLAAVAVVTSATMASAHTTARAEAGPDGSTAVTWSFSHGCEGRPTTGLRVQVPSGAWNVTATDPPGWTSTVSSTEIRWSGGSIPDGTSARFTAAMVLREPAGSTVTMPAIQECTDGAELAWIASPTTADGTESTRPAPTIVVPVNSTRPPVTSAASTTVTTMPTGPTTTRPVIGADAVTRDGSPSSTAGLWMFVLVCAVIAGGAGGLFLRQRRRRRQSAGEGS